MHPDVVNVDWSLNIRIKKSPLLRLAVSPLLDARRRSRLEQMGGRLLAHDLSKGIPFASDSVDAVYHSHVLEHLDRPVARGFMKETLRVLKPGGICRIVVPDFEFLCRAYVRHADRCQMEPQEAASHEGFVESLIEQSVRREAAAAGGRKGLARLLENIVLGDARRRGETHQWMYDRITLPHILKAVGYADVAVQSWTSSRIPGWDTVELDRNEQGGEYTPDSLYVEAQK
ncbi:MAG: methyltransferase domain-containing protein [Steroidobacteraceae bacterium]